MPVYDLLHVSGLKTRAPSRVRRGGALIPVGTGILMKFGGLKQRAISTAIAVSLAAFIVTTPNKDSVTRPIDQLRNLI